LRRVLRRRRGIRSSLRRVLRVERGRQPREQPCYKGEQGLLVQNGRSSSSSSRASGTRRATPPCRLPPRRYLGGPPWPAQSPRPALRRLPRRQEDHFRAMISVVYGSASPDLPRSGTRRALRRRSGPLLMYFSARSASWAPLLFQQITRCHSGLSCFSPPCPSTADCRQGQRGDAGGHLLVLRTSGSAPKFPISMTLLRLRLTTDLQTLGGSGPRATTVYDPQVILSIKHTPLVLKYCRPPGRRNGSPQNHRVLDRPTVVPRPARDLAEPSDSYRFRAEAFDARTSRYTARTLRPASS